MIQKLSIWLSVALAGGVLVAGCGSSSTSTTVSQSSSGATPTGSGATPTGSGTTATGPTASAQSVAHCKQAVQAQSNLSASVKAKFEAACEAAASGDQTARRKAAQEACVELVNASHLTGAARERALSVCSAP